MKISASIPVKILNSWFRDGRLFTEVALDAKGGGIRERVTAIIEGVPSFVKGRPTRGDIINMPVECEVDGDTASFIFGKRELCLPLNSVSEKKIRNLDDLAKIMRTAMLFVGNLNGLRAFDNGYRISDPEHEFSGRIYAIVKKEMDFPAFSDFARTRISAGDGEGGQMASLWKSLLFRYMNGYTICGMAWAAFLKEKRPFDCGSLDTLFAFMDFAKTYPPMEGFFGRVFPPIGHAVDLQEFTLPGVFRIRETVEADGEIHELATVFIKSGSLTEKAVEDACAAFAGPRKN